MCVPELSAGEKERVLKSVLRSRDPLRLARMPVKQGKKLVVLELVSQLFSPGRTYSQQEVNALLEEVYDDPVTLRRELIDFHFLCRTENGSAYWRAQT